MNLKLNPTISERDYYTGNYMHYEFGSTRLARRVAEAKSAIKAAKKEDDVSAAINFLIQVEIGPIRTFNSVVSLEEFVECWCLSRLQVFHVEEDIYVYEVLWDHDGSVEVFTLEEEIVPRLTLYGRTQILDDLKFRSVAYLTPCKMRYMHLEALLELIEFVSLPIREGQGKMARSFRHRVPPKDMITVFKQAIYKMECLFFILK